MRQHSPLVRENILFYVYNDTTHTLPVGTHDWYTWLVNATIFTVESQYGTFTAHKERSGSRRGGWYWRAYRRRKGKLQRVYLGKDEDVTLERLQQVALTLSDSKRSFVLDSATREEHSSEVLVKIDPASKEASKQEKNDQFLLSTKFHIPYASTRLVQRLRLLQRLNEDVSGKILLVTAPAGFGKSAFLSDWVRQREQPVAWVSLDEGDNDMVRFLTYVITALENAQVPVGESTLPLLQSPQLSSIESILTTLLHEITASSTALTLIFDDYHEIASQDIHDALLYLLDHLPPQMCLCIASRSELPLPLARLRVRGLLLEVHAEDLRFTSSEAAIFLRQIMSLPLSDEQIALLETSTEGWVAGLQIAALSLRGRDDITSMLDEFVSANRYITDYLLEEVFQRQTEEVQTFFLRTAILNRFCSPLCDVLLKSGNSKRVSQITGQSILEQLEQENLFLVALDDKHRWYRYHHLFLNFLRNRVQKLHADWIPLLHRQASTWYAENALMNEAIGHALAGDGWQWAAQLIEQTAVIVLTRGELTTLLTWLKALPDEIVRARPRLCILYAWVLVFSGQVDEVEVRLQDAEEMLNALLEDDTMGNEIVVDDPRGIQGEIHAIEAMVALTRGDVSSTITHAYQALEHLPESNFATRCVAALTLGSAFRMNENAEAASQAFAEAMRFGQATGNILVTLLAGQHMGQLQKEQGLLHKAVETYEKALQYAEEGKGKQLPTTALLHIGMSEVLLEWNELDAAYRAVMNGLELGRVSDASDVLLAGYMALANVQYAQGNQQEVSETLKTVERFIQRVHVPWLLSEIAAHRAHVRLMQGDSTGAVRWMQEWSLSEEDELHSSSSLEYLTLVRVYIAQQQHDKAFRLLSRLQQRAEVSGNSYWLVAIYTRQAVVLQEKGNIAEAMKTLKQALSLAEPEEYVRTFVNEGMPMVSLLRRAASQGISPRYIHQLLAAFSSPRTRDDVANVASPSITHPLIELLHTREHEVLHLIALGRSNQEIAQELVVSLGTVKTHINNIFRKLDVHTRTQAIARAKELHLLSV